MNVSIHKVESISCSQEAHWQDKPDIAFYALTIQVMVDGNRNTISLFSDKPMKLTSPDIKVVD